MISFFWAYESVEAGTVKVVMRFGEVTGYQRFRGTKKRITFGILFDNTDGEGHNLEVKVYEYDLILHLLLVRKIKIFETLTT